MLQQPSSKKKVQKRKRDELVQQEEHEDPLEYVNLLENKRIRFNDE